MIRSCRSMWGMTPFRRELGFAERPFKRGRKPSWANKPAPVTELDEFSQASGTPEFSALLRQLYKRAHPDLLRHSHPEQANLNDQSMQLLNGVLSSIKKENEYPPTIIQAISFYLRQPNQPELSLHTLHIRTAGGACQRQLTDTFVNFFNSTGQLAPKQTFVWGREYFPIVVDNTYTPKIVV